MHKIAVCVKNIGANQIAFDLIRHGNKLMEERADIDLMAFFESMAPPVIPMKFAAMHIMEGHGYDGIVIATDLSTAQKALRFSAAQRRLFWCYDLEWMRQQQGFPDLVAIYRNPKLELFARCEDHARLIAQCWNRPVSVCMTPWQMLENT